MSQQLNTDTIQNLIEMGLSEREAKVYRVLLGVPEITASAIPKFTDIPRTKVYEALNSLIRKGFCKEIKENANTQAYSAVNPQIALKGLMEMEEARVQALKKTNAVLIEALSNIYESSSSRLRDYEFVEILKGQSEITYRYTEFRNNSKSCILEFTKGEHAIMSEEDINKEADSNLKLIEAGVEIKVIYEQHDISQWNDLYWYKKNEEIGVESRIVDKLPIKMSLFDSHTIALFFSDPIATEPNMTAIIIKHQDLYNVLKTVFYNYWETSRKII